MIFLWNEGINHVSFVDYPIMPLYARAWPFGGGVYKDASFFFADMPF
jgi:hypothetical protein